MRTRTHTKVTRLLGGTGQHDANDGLVIAAGLDVSRAAVTLDDLKHNVQPEAEALAAACGTLTAPEGIEQVVLEPVRNGARIHDGKADRFGVGAVEPHSDRGLRLAMFERIADQIGGDLRDSLGIPKSEKLARAR